VEVTATHILISALDGGKCSALRPGRFTFGKEPTISIG